jgi:hypothetical protein
MLLASTDVFLTVVEHALQIRGEDLILDAAAAGLQFTLCFQSGTYLTLGNICMAADCHYDLDGRAATSTEVKTEPPPTAIAPPPDTPVPATAAPVTKAPVTKAPWTRAPATRAPATAKPTAKATAAPVTAAPTVKPTVKATAAPTHKATAKPVATVPPTKRRTAAPTTAAPTTAAPTAPAPAAAIVTGQLRIYCDSSPPAAALQSGIANALGEGIQLTAIASSPLQPAVAVQSAAGGSVRSRQLAASSYIDVAFTAQYDPATTAAGGSAVARVLNILDSKAGVIAAAVGQPASSVVIMTAQYCLAGLTSCPEASRLRMPPNAGTGRTAPTTTATAGASTARVTALGYAAMPILAAMTLFVLGCCAGLLLCCTRQRRTRKRANTGRKGIGAFLQLASPASSSGSGAAALGSSGCAAAAGGAQGYEDDDDEFIARSSGSNKDTAAAAAGAGGATAAATAAAVAGSSKYSKRSPDSSVGSGNPFLEPLDSPVSTNETRSRRTRSGVSSDDGSVGGTRSASDAARQSLVDAGYPAPPTTRAPFEGGGFEASHRGPGGTQGVLRAGALQERDDRDLSDANRYCDCNLYIAVTSVEKIL